MEELATLSPWGFGGDLAHQIGQEDGGLGMRSAVGFQRLKGHSIPTGEVNFNGTGTQEGEFVAKQRSTSIRYRADEARRLNSFAGEEEDPHWANVDLEAAEKEKNAYYDSFLTRGHAPRPSCSWSPPKAQLGFTTMPWACRVRTKRA